MMSNSEIITTDNFFNSFDVDHNEIDDVFIIYCMCLICFAFVQKIHFFPFGFKKVFSLLLLLLMFCFALFCFVNLSILFLYRFKQNHNTNYKQTCKNPEKRFWIYLCVVCRKIYSVTIHFITTMSVFFFFLFLFIMCVEHI